MNGQYGYVNEKLEPQCEFVYEKVSAFYNHVAAVKKDGKWTLIDDEFRLVTDFLYEDVVMDEFGYCSMGERIFVKKDGLYQMINLEGDIITEVTFENAYPFMQKDQLAAVKKGSKWGFVNENGDLCIDYIYDEAKSFTIEFAPVKQNDNWGYIDREGKTVIPYQFAEATEFYKVL